MRSLRDGFLAPGIVVVLAVVSGRAADDSPKARLAAIEAAQKVASERYGKALQKVERTEAAQRPAIDRFLAEVHRNVEKALELARANPDDPVAFEALKFVIRTNRAGPGGASARALRMILERGYDRLPDQAAYLPHLGLLLHQYPDAERLLRRVYEEHPSRDVRGEAGYWLASYLIQQAALVRKCRNDPPTMKDYEGYIAAAPIATLVKEKDPVVLDREADALLERVVAEYGDALMAPGPDGNTQALGPVASGELFARRNLTVGKVVPEIEGTDHDGQAFRLSNFRGKVVVLTFSGNWCGPCVAMYPTERALVTRHRGKPFAMVSVNTDPKVETLRKAIDSGEITWRCWWDGSLGPITTRWGITGFPTILVLDPSGTIRFKDVRGEELDRAVDSLLGESSRERPGR